MTGVTGEKAYAFGEIMVMSCMIGLPGAAIGALLAIVLKPIIYILRGRRYLRGSTIR